MDRNAVNIALFVLAIGLAGCGTMSPTTRESIGRVTAAAAQAGAIEIARAIDEAAEEDRARALEAPGPRAEGDRLFLCWLDELGGEELFAPSNGRARDRCRTLHGQRDDPRHCRCEAAQ